MGKRSVWAWGGAGCLTVIFFLFLTVRLWQSVPRPLEQFSAYALYPLLVLQQKVITPIKSYFTKRAEYSALQAHLQKIEQERETLLAQNIELNAMIDHMQEVHELIDFKKRYEYDDAMLAQVLVRNCSEQSQFYLVDRGSRDGIVIDMVALFKDCIVGKVIEVYPHYSKVLLVTDQLCKVASVCARSKALGIYQGTNSEYDAHLEHVSHLEAVEEDDLILSTGEGLIFPRGFALGRVKDWDRDGLFYHISVEPIIDVHALNYCYLVQKGDYKSAG